MPSAALPIIQKWVQAAAKGEYKTDKGVRLIGLVGPEAVVARSNRHAAIAHQDDEDHHFEKLIAIGESVPGNQGQREERREGENQRVGPVDRGFLHAGVPAKFRESENDVSFDTLVR